jgi:hypothetical protein
MRVEIFVGEDANEPRWKLIFEFLPRIGEYLSIDEGHYFSQWYVVEIWHRQVGVGFRPCLRVKLRD